MRRSTLILGAAMAVAGCASGLGRRPPGDDVYRPAPPSIVATPAALFFAGMDRDGDAVVGRGEMEAGIAAAFASGDGAATGSLSVIAATEVLERWLGSGISVPSATAIDRNGDRQVTRAEFLADFASRFAEFDADGDGMLTRAELLTTTRGFEERARPGGMGRGAPPGDRRRD